jgi:uncharacterized protein (DUF433 family)
MMDNRPSEYDWVNLSENGIYTIPFAARLLSAKPEKLRSWVEGYTRAGAEPILTRDGPRIGGKTVLSFLDLVESAWVRHFRGMGYSAQTIRKVAIKLRERNKSPHPFAWDKRFRGDGKTIFEETVTDEGEKQILNLMNDNFEMADVIEPSLFDQIVYVNDLAREFIPLREHSLIICNPKVAFGRPIVRGTWIPTAKLYKAYLVEGGVSEVADEYNLSQGDVQAAVKFEKDLNTRTLH